MNVTELKQTDTFRKWMIKLRDETARGIVVSRLNRLAYGLPGDVKPVGQGISELRIDYGPGYRVYYQQRGETIVLLLCGGNKKTQDEDIKTAKNLAAYWSEP
jgi:putative addiction module killer protein